MSVRLLACLSAALLGACVGPVPVMEASPQHITQGYLVALGTVQPAQRVYSARLVYGQARPLEVPILDRGGAGALHAEAVPEAVRLSWTDAAGRVQERELALRAQLPASMAGRTLRFEIDDSRLQVFVDTPVGVHDIERRAIYSD